VPGYSSDWHGHKLKKGPLLNLLPLHDPIGTLAQWGGQTDSTQTPVPLDANGLPIPCMWCAIMDESNANDYSFVLQEDGSEILMESCG
jgi:hypothetical protein